MENIIIDQPLASSKETFAWFTNVIEALDGSEQRISLHSVPRLKYEFTIHAHKENRNAYLNNLRNYLTENWLIPDWLSAVHIGRIGRHSDTLPKLLNQSIGDKFVIYQNYKTYELNEWIKPKKNNLELVLSESLPEKNRVNFW